MTFADNSELSRHRHVDEILAPIMFCLAIFFLIILAALIVAWVDIPRVAELAAVESSVNAVSSQMQDTLKAAQHIGHYLFTTLLLLWPVFIAEALYHAFRAKHTHADRKHIYMRLACAALPPLRLGTASTAWGGRLWLPILSWQLPGKRLSKTLMRFFGKPMIAIALLILPILLLEFVFKSLIAEHRWLQLLIHTATGFIWFAFTVEFILMVSAADKKLRYVKKNWIDLAIILLPLISFLRSIRALRLAKLAKVQQLAKMGRVYRMRGLGMKLFRALLLFEVVNRVFRVTPEKQLAKLELEREEQLEELEELDLEIAELKQAIRDNKT